MTYQIYQWNFWQTQGYCLNFQTLATYTLVDGNTGQKLVDEKDIGNNESIRTEYDIEEVNVDCEE